MFEQTTGLSAINTVIAHLCNPAKQQVVYFWMNNKEFQMVYAYLRVSTDSQDTENQRTGVDAKAKALGLNIDKYVIDNGVSGTIDPCNRKFGKLLKTVKSGDIIIVSELSRLGRRLFMLFRILETLLNKGVIVYSVKDGYSLDNTLQSKVLAFAFGMAAEIERDMISQRTKESLGRIKASGRKLGRNFGCKNKHHKLDGKENLIQDLLHQGLSNRKIAKKLQVSSTTINHFIKTH